MKEWEGAQHQGGKVQVRLREILARGQLIQKVISKAHLVSSTFTFPGEL